MRQDKFNNPIFDSNDILELMYCQHLDIFKKMTVDEDPEIIEFEQVSGIKFEKFNEELQQLSIEEFDQVLQSDWFIPDEYKNMDIKQFLLDQCNNDIETRRIIDEYYEFSQRNMINLLLWLKYFVDTCYQQNIVIGVGRGSSVASFVLYKLGVHKINSIKHDLDYKEFLR